MTYSKPEVAVLGDAVRVIETLGKPFSNMQDGAEFNLHPAYDLDE